MKRVLVAALLLGGCAMRPDSTGPDARTDIQIWQLSLNARSRAFVELRCRGLDQRAAESEMIKRFRRRQHRIEAALRARHGSLQSEDVIPVGHRCPTYRGAGRDYDRLLDLLERRMGLSR